MKILITGGAGFIGVNLSKRLLDQGNDIVCMDNFFSSNKRNLSILNNYSNFESIEHDVINSFESVVSDIQFDEIYHLACPASPEKYQKDHIYTLKVNFEGTLNVLNFAQNQKEKFGKSPKILFTSTSEVYGDPLETPQDENYRGNVNPHGIRSCYDEGKRIAESLCMNFCRQHNLNIKIVRIFNTYGPFMDKNDGRAVSNFIMQSLFKKNLTVYGDGSQTRSFQYIDDLIDGLISYMELNEIFPGPINIGNPEEITILDLAKKIIKLTATTSSINFLSLPSDDPLTRKPDITLANQKLNFKPKISLDEGLKKTIEYFQSIV